MGIYALVDLTKTLLTLSQFDLASSHTFYVLPTPLFRGINHTLSHECEEHVTNPFKDVHWTYCSFS